MRVKINKKFEFEYIKIINNQLYKKVLKLGGWGGGGIKNEKHIFTNEYKIETTK